MISIVVNILSGDKRKSALCEQLYAGDLVLKADTMEKLEEQFIRWKKAFEGERLKVNFSKTKIMKSGGGDSLVVVWAKIDPCGVCGKRAKVNCVRCKTCKDWVHARCARVKRVSCRMNENFECRVCMNVSNEKCNNV